VQAVEALCEETLHPFVGVPWGQARRLGRLFQGRVRFLQEQQQPCPAGQAGRQGGGAKPVLQLTPLRFGQADGKGLLTAAHGDTGGRGTVLGCRMALIVHPAQLIVN